MYTNINIYTQKDILHTDLTSAFQNIDRQVIINQLSETCPEVASHFKERFNNNSKVIYMSKDATTSIPNSSGVPQGDSASPNLFCYGANAHNHGLKNMLLDKDPEAIMTCYADDNKYISNHEGICATIHYNINQGPKSRLYISPEKSSIILGYKYRFEDIAIHSKSYQDMGIPSNHIHIHPLNGINNDEKHNLALNHGYLNHGIPVGAPLYVQNCMEQFKLKIADYFTKIHDRLPDNIQLQFSFILKTACCRINHVLRGLPYIQCKDLIDHFNFIQRKWLCSILQVDSINDSVYKRMCHPTGLGLSDPNNIADAAFISSIVSAMNAILKILPDFKEACRCYYFSNIPSSSCELVNHFVNAVKVIRSFDDSVELDYLLNLHLQSVYDLRDLQHDLTELVLKVKLSEINRDITSQSICNQQLYESFKSPLSRSFFLVTPKSKYDPNTMDNITFRTALQQFCLLDISSIQLGSLCSCRETQVVDRQGIHLKKCPIIGNIYADNIAAHDKAVKLLQRMALFHGFKVDTEVLLKTLITTEEDDQTRMDLVLKYANVEGNKFEPKVAIDVCIIGSCTKQQENGTQGLLYGDQIFKSAEDRKDRTYLKKCNDNNIRFITVAITREGSISTTTKLLFNMMAEYGSRLLHRNPIQILYFERLFVTSIIKDQIIILNKKINALSVIHEIKINILLKELAAFIEDSEFHYQFPIEIENSVLFEHTTELFEFDSLDDSATILDEVQFHDYNGINTMDSIDSLSDPD